MNQAENYRAGASTVSFPIEASKSTGAAATLRHWLTQHWTWLLFAVATVGALNNHLPFVMPGLYEIDPFDQSLYIFRGKTFAEGVLAGQVLVPDPAWNPLGSILYGLAYLPNQSSASWLVRSEWMVRAVLYVGLWVAALSVARSLRPAVSIWWMLALCAAVMAFPFVLGNNSDTLFAILSALALAQMLQFHRSRSTARLAIAAVFLGLGALTRADGLVLTATVSLVVVVLTLREGPAGSGLPTLGKRLAALLVPAAVLVGGYQAVYQAGEPTQSSNLGERTYMAFEQGEGVTRATAAAESFERAQEVRTLYGTPEQNGYSVITAIRNNPQAFAGRVVSILISGIPLAGWLVYGPYTSPFVVVFAGVAAVTLVRRGQGELLLLLGAWSLHLGAYLLTFIRTGYLALPFAAILALAAVGAHTLLAGRPRRVTIAVGVAGLVIAAQAGLLTGRLFPTGVSPTAYEPAEGKAAEYLQASFKTGTGVATFAPRAIWRAGLNPVLTGVPVDFDGLVPVPGDFDLWAATSPQDVAAWMRSRGAEVLYLDGYMSMWQPKLHALAESGIGTVFEVAFAAEEESPRHVAYFRALANGATVDTDVRVLKLRTTS